MTSIAKTVQVTSYSKLILQLLLTVTPLNTSLYACILALTSFICYKISLHCNSIAFVSCLLSLIWDLPRVSSIYNLKPFYKETVLPEPAFERC